MVLYRRYQRAMARDVRTNSRTTLGVGMSDIDTDNFTGSEVKAFIERIIQLESENKRLQNELTGLSGKTGFCTQCESYARDNERLREALEKIAKGLSYERHSGMDSENVSATRDHLRLWAQEALSNTK